VHYCAPSALAATASAAAALRLACGEQAVLGRKDQVDKSTACSVTVPPWSSRGDYWRKREAIGDAHAH
jgi:hypothetical protein